MKSVKDKNKMNTKSLKQCEFWRLSCMHPRKAHTHAHTGMRNGPAYVHADSSACAPLTNMRVRHCSQLLGRSCMCAHSCTYSHTSVHICSCMYECAETHAHALAPRWAHVQTRERVEKRFNHRHVHRHAYSSFHIMSRQSQQTKAL